MKVSTFNVSVVSPCQQLSRAPYLRYIPAHRALQACLRTLVGNETTINCAASCFLSTSSSHALPCGEFWVQWGEHTVPWQLWLSIVIYWKLWYRSQSPYKYSAVRKVPMKLMQKRSWFFYFRKRKTESEREKTLFLLPLQFAKVSIEWSHLLVSSLTPRAAPWVCILINSPRRHIICFLFIFGRLIFPPQPTSLNQIVWAKRNNETLCPSNWPNRVSTILKRLNNQVSGQSIWK